MSDTTKSSGYKVQEENLTIRDHLDPDKHWIGETLPIPTQTEIAATVGSVSSPGDSPFPARADHMHKLGTGVVTSANIADGTITGTDIANGTITDAKLASDVLLPRADHTAVTTNGSGVATITHGLGRTPQGWTAIVTGTTVYICSSTGSANASTFGVTVFRRDTGAVLASAAVNISWVAW